MTTWDPARKATDVTLSNGNLTATQNSLSLSFRSVFGTTSKASGKYYCTFTTISIDNNAGFILGIGNSSATLVSFVGSDANGTGIQANSGVHGGTGTASSYTTGNTLLFAVDVDAKKLWIRVNSSWTGSDNPSTGTGGISYTWSGAAFLGWSGFDGSGNEDHITMAPTTQDGDTKLSGFSSWDPPPPVAMEWGFAPALPDAQRDWFNRAAIVPPGANIAAPLFDFLPGGWQQTGGWTPPAFRRYPAPSTVIAAIGPAPAPVGWGFSPNNPQPPRRSWERSAGSLPSPLNIANPLFDFPPGGWAVQSPPPPRRRWERAASILPAGFNIAAPLFDFQPYGWAPTLPVIPAFRRKYATQELTWQEPFIFNFVVVPLEWGFPPVLPIAQRNWFNRAAVLPASVNLDAPYIFVLAHEWGFQSQPPQPPHRRWERSAASLPASLNIPEPFVFVPAAPAALEWGFVLSPAYLPRRRWERLAAALPAAFNIATPYVFVASSQRPQILVIIG